ncbi:MAG: universal stress protein [Gammaproteobacteria bacterium]|nr:universal stress protein [Gammaproteobacteria bacterium]MDP2346430.1 universal stress protein [Gammaproteobacteria bacterium]
MTNIIACIDGSSAAEAVCDAAAWASLRLAAPLRLLHVLDRSEYPTHGNLSGNIGLGTREHLLTELVELDEKRGRVALEQGRHMLEAAQQRAAADGAKDISTVQRHGSLLETLAEMEAESRLLVMGRQGEAHEHETHAIGSHLENVIRTIQRPILIALPGFIAPRTFMIAYDGSATATKALEMVAASPLLKGLPCHVVMVLDPGVNRDAELDAGCARLDSAGFNITRTILEGEVEPALHKYQRVHSIDLMVMGAYGHSRIRQFLVGSNTTRMLSQSDIPLLLLR